MYKKTILFAIVALGAIGLALEYFYPELGLKKKAGYWYNRGRKAVGV
ncbi:MAG TPA: hypothetical protein VFA47_07395 [Candidatus Manganitrophaceae bacterium]|nr:hypothetical protein [Candidatus Manganitrophaceae bacterium]